MNDLMDLYQELILDHNRQPRNRGALEGHDHDAEGYNPLCGDRVHVYVILKDDVIEDIRFDGNGCAISTASASLMSEAVKGRTIDEAKAIFEKFLALVTHPDDAHDTSALGKLEAFGGVGRFPARVKCATLAWHTLVAAVDERGESVTTE